MYVLPGHAVVLQRLEDDEALVGEAAGDGDHLAAQIGHMPDVAVTAHDDRTAVAVSEVNDLHRNALSPQGDGHRRDHERRLHPPGHQPPFDLRKTLEEARYEE